MKEIIKIAKREYQRMKNNPIYWFSIIFAPLLCVVFFTTMMWQGLPTNLPIGMVDQDNTTTTRKIARNLDAFQQTAIVQNYPDVSSARRAVQRGEIYAFYYIPKGTTAKANAQKIPTISFYTNYAYLVAGSLVMRDMRMMSELASGSAGRSVLYARGATEQQALAFLQPIVVDSHATNNPWLNYNIYLSNTIVPGILGIFLFMMTVYSIGTEIKEGTAHDWILKARGNMHVALIGKLLPNTLLFLLVGWTIVFYFYGYMHFPCNSGITDMLILMTLFILSCEALGILMITILPTLRLGLSFASLWGVLSLSICGMSFPVMAMHPALQGLSWLFPLRHYFILYVNCALDGYNLTNAWPYLAALAGFILLSIITTPILKRELLTVKYVP